MLKKIGCAAAVLLGLVAVLVGAYGLDRFLRRATVSTPGQVEQDWFTAARTGDVARLRELHARGVALDAHESHHGRTALMRAAFFGHRDAVQWLIAAGADVAALDAEGATALHLAASVGESAVVSVLVRAGADTNARKAPDSVTPLFAAVEGGHDATVAALLAGKARPGEGSQDMSPLERAIDRAAPAIVAQLLAAGASAAPSGLAHGGEGLLSRAIDQCQDEDPIIIAALVKAGVDAAAVDRLGRTAHYWASYHAGRPSPRQACSQRQLAALVAAGVTR